MCFGDFTCTCHITISYLDIILSFTFITLRLCKFCNVVQMHRSIFGTTFLQYNPRMQYQSCLFLSHISCLSKWDFPELGDNIVDSLLFRSPFYSSSCVIIGPTKWISHCLYVFTMSHKCLEWIFSCLNIKEFLAQNRCNAWILSECKRTWTS